MDERTADATYYGRLGEYFRWCYSWLDVWSKIGSEVSGMSRCHGAVRRCRPRLGRHCEECLAAQERDPYTVAAVPGGRIGGPRSWVETQLRRLESPSDDPVSTEH